MWSAPDKNKNDKKNDTKKENDTTKAVITEEPGAVYAAAEGIVKDIEASTDPTFANKVLGDGVVIFPEDGTVMAPCKGNRITRISNRTCNRTYNCRWSRDPDSLQG